MELRASSSDIETAPLYFQMVCTECETRDTSSEAEHRNPFAS
jgi:hypothetical protein